MKSKPALIEVIGTAHIQRTETKVVVSDEYLARFLGVDPDFSTFTAWRVRRGNNEAGVEFTMVYEKKEDRDAQG